MESYLNLVRGTRLGSFMGLRMDDGVPYKFHENYTHIMVPATEIVMASGEDEGQSTQAAKRNQRVRIMSGCVITPRGASTIALVEPNPELAKYGDIQPAYHVHPGETVRPGIYITLRKDIKLTDIEYAVRLYLHG